MRRALFFIAIGLLLYAALAAASERLLYRTGHSNPFFKIATTEREAVDWVILGASHAMTLDFADMNATLERASGRSILNLAAPGTGPLYNRFVLEQFLSRHRAAHLLYIADSFAFTAPDWNEDRFADAKLLRTTPFDGALAQRFARYCRDEGVDWRALLDYLVSFSKINNRERFARDVWEGEAQFERIYRPSSSADAKRVAYLYPKGAAEPAALSRYLGELDRLIAVAREQGVEVVVVKPPVPAQFHALLPGESDFDESLSRLLDSRHVPFHDFSLAMDAPRFYFDTDHLNRAGVIEFFAGHLQAILTGGER